MKDRLAKIRPLLPFTLILILGSCDTNKKRWSGWWCDLKAYEYAQTEEGKNDELMQFYNAKVDGTDYRILPNSIRISYDEMEVLAPGTKLRIVKIENDKIYVQTESGYAGTLFVKPIEENVIELSLIEYEENFFSEEMWFSPKITDTLHRFDIVK